jgi:branched-chain amino acid transport system ATP-binding protein
LIVLELLSLANISVYYGQIKAISNVSIKVMKGEIVTLLGANGAGKSTTLKAISGIVPPRSGSIIFNGRQIERLAPYQIARLGIGHVPEGRRVFPTLTVLENLQIGAVELAKSRFGDNMEKVTTLFPRLKERLKQKAGTLSGGEQQMLAVSRALMGEPKLVMLDEPSMGLAPAFVEQIFEVILGLRKEGITILLVEQNALESLEVANRGYVIQMGEIVVSGSNVELQENEMVRAAYLGEGDKSPSKSC